MDGEKGNKCTLKFTKFQNVESLQIFVGENSGEEEVTQLQALEIFGTATEGSNIADWKPVKS